MARQAGRPVSSITVSELEYAPPGADSLFFDVSFGVAPGEHAALVGANGVGKSTILRILSGVLEADSGAFAVGGTVLTMTQDVGMANPDDSLREMLIEVAPAQLRDAGRTLVVAERAMYDGTDDGMAFAEALTVWGDLGGYELEAQWAARGNAKAIIGSDPPRTAPWGYCDRGLPREALVSPYRFKTAAEHYAALLAETKQRGGPTEHTYATVPGDIGGRYLWPRGQNWYAEMFWTQIPTVLSLLTPEYQTRMVEELYHDGHTNAQQWPAQYCWPEGFMRRWHEAAVWEHHMIATPSVVQIVSGVARNFITTVHIGREFNMEDVAKGGVPRLGQAVPRWYGETIGFWDKDTLITWTSNIQGWNQHSSWEWSDRLEVIEVLTPARDASGKFLGLDWEAVIYDAEALAQPVRILWHRNFQQTWTDAERLTWNECLRPLYPIDGFATQAAPGEIIRYRVPDLLDRPWAKIWEEYFEKGMQRPEREDFLDFSRK